MLLSENSALLGNLEHEGEAVTGDLRKLHNVEFRILYSGDYMKEYEMVGAYNSMRNAYIILIRYLKGRDHIGNMDVDGRIILKYTL
jgi:hypothetical protein